MYWPANACPRCGIDILEAPGVELKESRLLKTAGVSRYKCACGFEFWRAWPGVADIVRQAKKRRLEGC